MRPAVSATGSGPLAVLHVHDRADLTGVERLSLDLAARADRTRFLTSIACPEGPLAEECRRARIAHIPYSVSVDQWTVGIRSSGRVRLLKPSAVRRSLGDSLRLSQIVRAGGFGLLHTHGVSAHIAGLGAGLLTGIPLLWHVHVVMPRPLFWFSPTSILISDAQRRACFASPPPRARLIYNGADPERFRSCAASRSAIRKSLALSASVPLVLHVGHFDPVKNQKAVTRAFREVVGALPEAKLAFLGKAVTARGPRYLAETQALVKQLGLQDSVRFLGFRDDVPLVLGAADVVVSFTRDDALSLAVIEAMMAERPVVAMRSGGVPEIITDGESGVLVEDADIHALAASIGRLLRDPELRRRLGARARRRAVERFHIDDCVRAVEAVYEEFTL